MLYRFLVFSILNFYCLMGFGQHGVIRGTIRNSDEPVAFANVYLKQINRGASTDANGNFELKDLPYGTYELTISSIGYSTLKRSVDINIPLVVLNLQLTEDSHTLGEVVITGTMKEVSRAESPVPVEIITPKLFQKNPTPSLFEAVGMVNGVQPQLNCSVCNTGDIHINGMEGPYTMMLIDGMPIVSALSTVYGLNGIPNSMVERIEVVKGPASSLYGSEAMGGIINVITKKVENAPLLSADVFATSWAELSFDASIKHKIGKASSLLGVNYYNYQNPIDNNDDNFTDMTLQNRVSVFNKWNFERRKSKMASLAARYVYEDRWGGEMNWDKKWRGTDSVYGESIYTKRVELIGMYQWPSNQDIFTQLSYNWHNQNSWYGTTPYFATQQVAFLQTYWDMQLSEKHSLLLGASFRYTNYDDNTPATASSDGTTNQPQHTPIPGFFIQDEWKVSDDHKLLFGYRFDYDQNHGGVNSPRLAYKFSPSRNHIIRGSFGTGFRVVNLFTEDHAALTGAREVVITEELLPERSLNVNLNYELKIPHDDFFVGLDITGFYSYFTNKIIGDFDSGPDKIIYDNLDGYAISRGVSLNTDLVFNFPLKLIAGVSFMDVYQVEEDEHGDEYKSQQLHAPKWSGTFTATYNFPKFFELDLTGQWNGPMRLPVLPNDYRPEYSPWFAIVNVQLTKKLNRSFEVYGGIKNLFNFVPNDPIMRAFDPFDKQVDDPVNNPYGYTFDPGYNFASMQGRRTFLGVRYNLVN
ncbi:TonB-dependent receptor [Fulvivirga ligni]|uniref:TonB-dependent receptor n=1 Tax=Fulvivirga ligni TaxID=2904246 RepID=UPI001F1FA81C|nr:TonB-dependent receptor [Fulvivirga ligni]UII19678.1 TonB-dependent receptor [Fulvivirga ligni]